MTHPTPPHYLEGRKPEYEPRHVIREWGLNYHLGSAVKYISRYGRKGGPKDAIRDLEKAVDFLNFELETLRGSVPTEAPIEAPRTGAPDPANPKPGDKFRISSGVVYTVAKVYPKGSKTNKHPHVIYTGDKTINYNWDTINTLITGGSSGYKPVPYNDPAYDKVTP